MRGVKGGGGLCMTYQVEQQRDEQHAQDLLAQRGRDRGRGHGGGMESSSSRVESKGEIPHFGSAQLARTQPAGR